jgi:hypothetical protein
MAAIIDGLGHGLHAAEAARTGARAALSRPYSTTVEALTAIHEQLRHTRGAACTVVHVDLRARTVAVSGVGNVVAAIASTASVRHGVSLGGILGHEVRHFREFHYPWNTGATLVMHSDGLLSRWSLENYPGLRQRHVALTAAVLYRDFQRGRDDVTVLAGWEA